MSDKPLPPTQQRIKKAREDGNVPQSKDASSWLGVTVLTEVCFACFPMLQRHWTFLLAHTLSVLDQPISVALARVGGAMLLFIAVATAVLLLAAMLAGVIAAIATSSFAFAPKAMSKGMEKMNPANFLRQFVSPDTWVALGLSLIKTLAIGLVAYLIIRSALPGLPLLSMGSLEYNGSVAFALIKLTVRSALGVLLVLSIFDAWLKRKQWLKNLRMDFHEVKQEFKESMGNPEVKARFRQIAYQASQEAPARGVSSSNAVVVNPEHYAVALYFEEDKVDLPMVVAKGVDEDAQAMIAQARELLIPVIRYRVLARRLYATASVDQSIPRATFKAVALIYRIIDEIQSGQISRDAQFEIEDDDSMDQPDDQNPAV